MQRISIDRFIKPASKFIHQEYTSGIFLLLGVIVAIAWANSFPGSYHHVWDIKFSMGFNRAVLSYPIHTWINDGLMTSFFYVIGLELKREFIAGELSSGRKAALPMFAALGGMLVPALIYTLINHGTAASHGWGIPMATDIAFALALLSMAGKHIPASVKVFLSALAVADDLGAVLIITFFYSSGIRALPLMVGGAFLLVLVIAKTLGVRNTAFYLLVGFGVWVGFLLSGIHATVAGILVAFTIPARTELDEKHYSERLRELSNQFDAELPNSNALTTPQQHETIEEIRRISFAAQTPLQKVEHALHPWVAFVVIPLFAVANAGIVIRSNFFSALLNPISFGVMLGLLIGKFVGVLSFTWLLVKTGFAGLPTNATWRHMVGVAALTGLGFTMSLFISILAFDDPAMIDQAKYGILLASLLSGTIGIILLKQTKLSLG